MFACVGRPSRRRLAVSSAAVAITFAALIAIVFHQNQWAFDGWLNMGWAVTENAFWPVLLFAAAVVASIIGRMSSGVPFAIVAIVWAGFSAGSSLVNHPDATVAAWSVVGILLGVVLTSGVALLTNGYRLQLVKGR